MVDQRSVIKVPPQFLEKHPQVNKRQGLLQRMLLTACPARSFPPLGSNSKKTTTRKRPKGVTGSAERRPGGEARPGEKCSLGFTGLLFSFLLVLA